MPKKLFALYGLAFLIIAFGASYVFFYTRELSGALVTHYDLVRGIDFLGGKADFYSVFLGLALISFLNFVISMMLYVRIRIVSYLVAWVTILLNLVGLYGIIYLVSLNV